MVHELGPPAGIHAVRHLPDHRRHRGAGLGDAGIASFDFPILAVLHVSVVWVWFPDLLSLRDYQIPFPKIYLLVTIHALPYPPPLYPRSSHFGVASSHSRSWLDPSKSDFPDYHDCYYLINGQGCCILADFHGWFKREIGHETT